MAALNDSSYRSDGGAIGKGASPTETRPADLVSCGFLRGAIIAGCGGTTGWAIDGGTGVVAAEFRKASTFAAKSAT
jgi:hypothetical protein